MSEDIVDMFDSLPPENAPRHLPVGGTCIRFRRRTTATGMTGKPMVIDGETKVHQKS